MQQEQETQKASNDSERGDPEANAIPPITTPAIAVWVFALGMAVLWLVIPGQSSLVQISAPLCRLALLCKAEAVRRRRCGGAVVDTE